MAVEKKWLAVPATPFTANGTEFGVVTIANTAGYKVKGYAFISANPPLSTIQVQIQRVTSPTTMIVGHIGTTPQPNHFINISAYTVASGAMIGFPEQDKNKIKADDIDQATYEADPAVAKRVIPVDQYGNIYSTQNPIPVTPGGVTPAPNSFGDVQITYDSNSNPTQYNFYLGGVLQGYIVVSYDSNSNPTNYQGYTASGQPL
jgi:hypothetical protein